MKNLTTAQVREFKAQSKWGIVDNSIIYRRDNNLKRIAAVVIKSNGEGILLFGKI